MGLNGTMLAFALFAVVALILLVSSLVGVMIEMQRQKEHTDRVRAAILGTLYEVPGLGAGALRWALASQGALAVGPPGDDPTYDRQLQRLIRRSEVKESDGRLSLSLDRVRRVAKERGEHSDQVVVNYLVKLGEVKEMWRPAEQHLPEQSQLPPKGQAA